MKLCAPIAAALLAIAMAGCAKRGKAQAAPPSVPAPAVAAVSPPSEPLSVPQTRVQLPPLQPLDPDALAREPHSETPPPAAVQGQTATPATRRPPAATASNPPPKPDPPAAAVPEPPPTRPSIQEVLTEGERNQLQEKAANIKKGVRAWLDATPAQRLSGQNKVTREKIQSFLKASDEAERRGDMRDAVDLAARAEILMHGMQNGR